MRTLKETNINKSRELKGNKEKNGEEEEEEDGGGKEASWNVWFRYKSLLTVIKTLFIAHTKGRSWALGIGYESTIRWNYN